LGEAHANDLVIFRPRKAKIEGIKDLVIEDWGLERGREIAREKGWDFYVLKANFQAFAHEMIVEGKPPTDVTKAFVGYCKKAKKLR
jgi:hypothetical protein